MIDDDVRCRSEVIGAHTGRCMMIAVGNGARELALPIRLRQEPRGVQPEAWRLTEAL
jgi:hypothetical protein